MLDERAKVMLDKAFLLAAWFCSNTILYIKNI
jgi:hypothetical protein